MTTPLRFANFLAFNANPTYAAISAEVARLLGVPTQFEEGRSFDQFFEKDLAVGYVCGLPYSKMSRLPAPPFELLVAPVLDGTRYAGQAVYYSDLIVPATSTAHTLADLRGSTFAYNETVSYSGYHVMHYFLKEAGLDWDHFGARTPSGAHLNSVAMIAAGDAAAAAIDSHALDVALLQDATLADKIRIIAEIGPSPMPPVVVASHLPAALKAELREIYLNLHRTPAMQPHLRQSGIAHYAAVTDAHYDLLRDRIDTTNIQFSKFGC